MVRRLRIAIYIKNYMKILNKIEYENNELERQKINELKEISDYKLRELLRYSKK